MSLSHYAGEVERVSEEILEYIEGPLKVIAHKIAKNKPRSINEMSEEERDAAIAFLQKTPSQRDKAVKTADENTALLLLRARYLGILATRTLRFGDEFQYVPGKSYRNAAAWAAQKATRLDLTVQISDLLPEHFNHYR